jgi:hypothetical protein
MKKIISLFLAAIMLCALIGCDKKKKDYNPDDATQISFKEALSYEYLKSLDGQLVKINGYMATSSPVDGSFMFLMNLPFQSCPFCVPNTSQLSNTIEVYAKSGESFPYTSQAISVWGVLEVAPSKDQFFVDEFGYQFNFKIVDAEYKILSSDELSGENGAWISLATSDTINELYRMYDYVNFVCAWDTYFVNSYVDENGKNVPGYYLYASDAIYYLQTDKAQYNYGYKDGYFDKIVSDLEKIDKEAFKELIANVRKAEALAEEAVAELEGGKYTSEYKYVEKFGTNDYVYTLTKGEELRARFDEIYYEFNEWQGNWEM